MQQKLEKYAFLKGIYSTSDSRNCKKGGIFFARKGSNFNGHNFIKKALENGILAVFYSENIDERLKKEFLNVHFFYEENLEAFLPDLLNFLYSRPKNLIAVTGTNGKTSVTFLAAQVFSLMGFKSGFIGTLGAFVETEGQTMQIEENGLTTPDIVSFYNTLHQFYLFGALYVFFEASSIGLIQNRIAGIQVDCACFTNFTQDHLDVHKTMESYFTAKTLLFEKFLKTEGCAILNKNDTSFEKLQQICKNKKIITYGNGGEIEAKNVKISPEKSIFTINELEEITINLAGKFQIENILCVISIVKIFNLDLLKLKQILPLLKSPKGRLEKVFSGNVNAPFVFVDYAHTPDSLLKALQTLKESSEKTSRIIAVFGCGGDRDKTKRKIMGSVASENSDFVIITDDNPRTEDATLIRKEIISGIKKNNFMEIEEREEAIKQAILMAKPRDIILIAGKGHEEYQIIGSTQFAFSDVKCAMKYL